MDALPFLRLILHLDPLSAPIQGQVLVERGHDADARAFSGWIELSSLIEQLRAEVSIRAGADAHADEPDQLAGG